MIGPADPETVDSLTMMRGSDTTEAGQRRRGRSAAFPVAVAVVAVLCVATAVVAVTGRPVEPPAPVEQVVEPVAPTTAATAAPLPSTLATPTSPPTAPAAPSRTAAPAAPAAPPPKAGWTLVAADGFDGSALNRTHWFPYSGRTAGGVGQHLEDNLTVADGLLTITGRGTTSGGLSWAPGQLYGRWEFRARADRGAGFGPVVLLWPDAEDWPLGGEIDVLEIPEPERVVSHVTVHSGPDDDTVGTGVEGDFTTWNTFAVEWTPDAITAFVNGRQVFRTTDPDVIPTRPMHLAIQQDVGPFGTDWIPAADGTTPERVRTQVDWVRIYSWDGGR